MRLRSAALTYRGWVQGPVTMPVLPFRCRRPGRLGRLVATGLGVDEGGDLVVQLASPVEAAVAAGHDGDLRVRHEASPVAGLRGGEHGAARAGDQQDRHVDRAEFVVGEDGGELRLHPVAAAARPHEGHQLPLQHGGAVQPPGQAAAQRHRGQAGQAADGEPQPEAGVELGEPGGVEQGDRGDPPRRADRLVHRDPAAPGQPDQVRRAVAELAEKLIQPGRAGLRRGERGAPDAGVRVAGHVDPVYRAVLGERGDVRVPARGVEPGPREEHDRRPAGMRPVGVHARGRGRGLDVEFLAGLRPQREGPRVRRHELTPGRVADPRSHFGLGCQHGRPPCCRARRLGLPSRLFMIRRYHERDGRINREIR